MSQAEQLTGPITAEEVATELTRIDERNVILLGSPNQIDAMSKIHSHLTDTDRGVASPLNVFAAHDEPVALRNFDQEVPVVQKWLRESMSIQAEAARANSTRTRIRLVSKELKAVACRMADVGPAVAVVVNIAPDGKTNKEGDISDEVFFQQLLPLRQDLGERALRIVFCQPLPEGSKYAHLTDPLLEQPGITLAVRNNQLAAREEEVKEDTGAETTVIPAIVTGETLAIEPPKEGGKDE